MNTINMRSRKGMALALSLIVLLVAGMIVGVSLYLTENLAAVSMMKSKDELLMNAALAGIEQGKIWLADSFKASKGQFPRRGFSSLEQAHLSDPVIEPLLAKYASNAARIEGTFEDIPYLAAVYDVNIDQTRNLDLDSLSFTENSPPFRVHKDDDAYSSIDAYRYFIKSTATMDGREMTVEQFVVVDYE